MKLRIIQESISNLFDSTVKKNRNIVNSQLIEMDIFKKLDIKEMNIASPGLLCKKSFLLKEIACAQRKKWQRKKHTTTKQNSQLLE